MSLLSKITTGRINRPQKYVIYAPEGFGKSTLASQMPAPIVLDLEGSTSQLDLQRLTRDDLASTAVVEAALKEIAAAGTYKTVVIDTVDWLEQMMAAELCAEHKQPAVVCNEKGSPFSYGRGTKLLAGKMTVFLSRLDEVIKSGLHVVLLAHSKIKKAEPPDGAGPYDRYELKLSDQAAAVVKEWADVLAFGNWRTQVVEKDKSESGQKFKGVGGRERLMYCNRASAYDAKNRHGLKDIEEWKIETLRRTFAYAESEQKLPVIPANGRHVTQEVVEKATEESSELSVVPTVQQPKPEEKPDDLDMTPAPDPALKAICEPHAAAITDYLLRNGKITAEQDWRYMSADFAARVLKNPAKFINVATNGKAVAA